MTPADLAKPKTIPATRREEMYRILSPAEIARAAEFSDRRRLAKGDALFRIGVAGEGLFVLITGRVRVFRADPNKHGSLLVEHGPGAIIGEVSGLSGRPALADVLVAAARVFCP